MRRALVFTAWLAILASAQAMAATKPAAKSEATPPKEREPSYSYDILDNSLIRPATRVLDVARIGRKISGNPREAANVDDAAVRADHKGGVTKFIAAGPRIILRADDEVTAVVRAPLPEPAWDRSVERVFA